MSILTKIARVDGFQGCKDEGEVVVLNVTLLSHVDKIKYTEIIVTRPVQGTLTSTYTGTELSHFEFSLQFCAIIHQQNTK